jgi:hypothetical protein
MLTTKDSRGHLFIQEYIHKLQQIDKQNIYGGIKWAKVIEKVRKERSGVELMAKEDRKV